MELSDFLTCEPIDKGWSSDKKYVATAPNGEKFMLRISGAEKLEAKKLEFEMMKRVEGLGVPMCRPIETGMCAQGVYSLQGWIEGADLYDVIDGFDPEKRYAYGLEAGRMLAKIHSIAAPDDVEPWEKRFNRKIDRKFRAYDECPVKFDGDEKMKRYINASRHLLAGRPQSFQHGDYHIGNMMVDRAGTLTIIDFDRADFGDPWEEFNRIVWCAQKSPSLARGMVDGYFCGNIPDMFWRLLELYISSNTLSSVYWALPFGQIEVDTMLAQAAEVFDWYDGMTRVVPRWYSETA